jgi:hypothetical protein
MQFSSGASTPLLPASAALFLQGTGDHLVEIGDLADDATPAFS